MQKALHLMNLKLTSVITDLTGLTGMQIIRTILAGERDPVVLHAFAIPAVNPVKQRLPKP